LNARFARKIFPFARSLAEGVMPRTRFCDCQH
jgi:hypothetical protein